MCLIIVREPNVVLDYEKFKTAVINNPDGWGISIPDTDGELFTLKSVKEATDTDTLYEWLHDDLKAEKFLLHLRYTTAGETSLRNAHPFPILEKGPDGADVRMAHNGTIHKYKPGYQANNKWESDTRVFVREYVRPLFKRLARGTTPEDILSDPFVNTLLDGEVPAMTVLAFIDGHGNTSYVNAKGNGGGFDAEGTYFSNDYSFDPTHRQGGKTYTMGKPYTSQPSNKNTPSGTKTTMVEAGAIKKFSDKMDMSSPEDIFLLSDEAIHALVQEEPELTEDLIKELIYRWYISDKKHSKATKQIARQKAEHTALENKLKSIEEKKNDSKAA